MGEGGPLRVCKGDSFAMCESAVSMKLRDIAIKGVTKMPFFSTEGLVEATSVENKIAKIPLVPCSRSSASSASFARVNITVSMCIAEKYLKSSSSCGAVCVWFFVCTRVVRALTESEWERVRARRMTNGNTPREGTQTQTHTHLHTDEEMLLLLYFGLALIRVWDVRSHIDIYTRRIYTKTHAH